MKMGFLLINYMYIIKLENSTMKYMKKKFYDARLKNKFK